MYRCHWIKYKPGPKYRSTCSTQVLQKTSGCRVQFLVLGGKISTRYFSHMQLQRFGRTGEVGKYIDPKLADPPVWSLPASRDPGECRICLVSLQSAPQVLDKAEEGVLSCLSCGVGNDALLGCRCLSGSPSHSRAVTRPSFSLFSRFCLFSSPSQHDQTETGWLGVREFRCSSCE